MIMRIAALAALAAFSAGPSLAEGLNPAQARRIELPGHLGTAYYTVQASNYLVVATLAGQAPGATPLRVQAALQPGQSLVLSTPGGVEDAPATFEIVRSGDSIHVAPMAATN